MAEHPRFDRLRGHRMTDAAVDAFLTEQGTGVLALADDGAAYAVPLSFGYRDGRLYFAFFRFDDAPRKEVHAEATDTACLCVYEVESALRWRSVLAFGPLESVGPDRWDEVGATMADNAWSPDLSSVGPRRGTVATYVLPIEEVTGLAGPEYAER